MSRARRAALVALVVGTVGVGATGGSPARAAAGVSSLRLAGQTVALAVDGEVVIDLTVDAQPDPGSITVSARALPAERDALRAALADTAAAPEDEVVVDEGMIGGSAPAVRLTIATESTGDDASRLSLPVPGPYAVTVSTASASLTTVVVRGVDGTPPTLPVAFAVVLDSPLTLQPDGTTTIDPQVRERVARVAGLLERSPVAFSVVIRPELLAGLGRSGVPGDVELVDRLAGALQRHTVIAAPWVAVDPSAAAAGDLGEVFGGQLLEGEETLKALLDRVPDRRVWVALDPLTAGGAALVRGLGASAVVRLAGKGIQPVEPVGDAPVADVVGPAGASVVVVDPDPVSTDLSTGSDDPVLAASRLAGELVATGVGSGSQGAVLVADLDTADIATLDAILSVASLENGLVAGRLVDVATLAGGPVDADAWSPQVADLTEPARRRSELADLAETTRAMLAPGDTRGDRWTELADAVLDSRLTAESRADYEDSLRDTLLAIQRHVVVLSPSTVNLGDRSSTVPVTIRNDNPFAVVVEVRLVSAKLKFPPTSDAVTVAAGETAKLRIPVDARTNGRFPVTAELVAPGTGTRVGEPVTFSVRAGRLTGLGIVITFAAVLILATWWVQHLRRNQRRRRLQAAKA